MTATDDPMFRELLMQHGIGPEIIPVPPPAPRGPPAQTMQPQGQQQLFGQMPQAQQNPPIVTVIKEPKAKPAEEKKKVPVETVYEGYTIRPVSPAVGDKKSWAYCTSNILYLDSAKLYAMAKEHLSKIGKDAQGVYRELSVDQQALVDRVVATKRAQETNPLATWEAYDIRRVRKDVRKNFLTVERTTVALELIIRRKDLTSGAISDKPAGTTTSPAKINGQVLDLSVSIDDYLKQFKKPAPAAEKAKPKPAAQARPPGVIPPNPNPALYFWNGQQWEMKTAEQIAQERAQGEARLRAQLRQQQAQHNEQMRQQHENMQNQFAAEREQQAQREEADRRRAHDEYTARMQHEAAQRAEQENLRRQQEDYDRRRPHAPMPPDNRNPFWPQNAHPGQFAPVIDHGEALDYDARARAPRRSRSQSRPRTLSRRRSRHRQDWSGSSDEDSYLDESTPPSSPPRSIGSLHRPRRHRTGRDDKYRIVEVEVPRRQRYVDDYPGPPQRRLTANAQGLEDARFAERHRPRRRSSYADDRYDPIWRRDYH